MLLFCAVCCFLILFFFNVMLWKLCRSEAYNNTAFNEWVNKGLAPPLPMSLRLYKKLKHLGFKIFLLTGRGESQRNVTQRNLLEAGYFGWDKLIFRFGLIC